MAAKKPLVASSGKIEQLQTGDTIVSVLNWIVTAASIPAVVDTGYLVDCSAGVITLTLPGSPAVGDKIGVCDFKGTSEIFNITVARNGLRIEGDASDLICDINGAGFTLIYTDAARGWKIVSEINRINGNNYVIVPVANASNIISYRIFGG